METQAKIEQLLNRWQESREQQQPLSAEQLCEETPELLEMMKQLIAFNLSVDRELQPRTDTIRQDSAAQSIDTVTYQAAGKASELPAPKFDRYEILRTLGQGGMGAVFHARDRKLPREVAIKVIRPDILTPSLSQRFDAEARTLAEIDHPNVIRIWDIGEYTPESSKWPAPYLVLEFVAGCKLTNILDGKPMPWQQAAQLILNLAEAMAVVHERGILHRDIKPDNILLADSQLSRPKLADFGLAVQTQSQERTTQTGMIMGTPEYMSPEQAESTKNVGPATDVWALGVMLYQLLTGKLPFKGTSTINTLNRVMCDAPAPVRKLCANVPTEVEAICLDCLNKSPEERPTMHDLSARLSALLKGDSPTLQRESRPRGQGWLIALGVILVAMLGLVAWSLSGKPNRAEDTNVRQKLSELPKIEPKANPLVIGVKVQLYARKGKDDFEGKGEVGEKGVPQARFDDAGRLLVELSEPAYCYVLALNFNGVVELLWPYDDDVKTRAKKIPPLIEKSLRFPQEASSLLIFNEEGAKEGMQGYVVVASRKELLAYEEWIGQRQVKWPMQKAGLMVWAGNERMVDVRELGVSRTVGKNAIQVPPLQEVCGKLKREGIDAVEGIVFGVKGE